MRRELAGPANLVTGLRLVLALPGYWASVSVSRFSWLVVVVVVAGVSDLLDGWVARRFSRPTRFGAAFDPIADGFFFGAVAAGLFVGGVVPGWLAWLVVFRYLVPVAVGAGLIVFGRLGSLRHTFFGQLSTLVIGVVLGGLALLRLGSDSAAAGWLQSFAVVAVPVLTVLAWGELARTAWVLSRGRRS